MFNVQTKTNNCYKTTVITGDDFGIITKGTEKYSKASTGDVTSNFARFFTKVNGNVYVYYGYTSLDFFSMDVFNGDNYTQKDMNWADGHNSEYWYHPARCDVTEDAVFPIRNFFNIKAESVENETALVSGGFFLLQTKEVDSQYSWFGDPFGLLISDYKVYSYATFERSCVVQDEDGSCFVSRLSCSDFDYGHNGVWVEPKMIYSRTTTVSNPFLVCEEGFVDFLLLNRRVHDKKNSGQTECPVSGIIVRFAYTNVPDWKIGTEVSVRFANNKKKVKFAIQCAPLLIEEGRVVLSTSSYYDDYLVTPDNKECLVPRVYDKGYMIGCDRIKVGIGFAKSNKLIWVALEPKEHNKITLLNVTNELLEHETIDAIALDGGGSVKAYHASNEIVGAKEKKRSIPYFIEIS
jgi:hypothetical protein